jgi:hypothetical protein
VTFVGAIQQMAIQSTTPIPKRVTLNHLGNTLVALNDQLADSLNAFFKAPADQSLHQAVLSTVEQVQEVTRDVVEEMERERQRITELGLFSNFLRMVTTVREFNALEREVIVDEHDLIKERGVLARLRNYQETTGYQPSQAVLELAKSGDKLEGILEEIQFTLSFQPENLNSLANSLNIGTFSNSLFIFHFHSLILSICILHSFSLLPFRLLLLLCSFSHHPAFDWPHKDCPR